MKLLATATAAFVATALMTTVMIGDAQAGHKTETKELKCEEMIGSFYNPIGGVRVYTSSYGKCNNLGSSTLTSVVDVVGTEENDDEVLCAALASPSDLPGWALSEKGFIVSSTSGVQCFFNSSGDSVEADEVTGFCGSGDNEVHQ